MYEEHPNISTPLDDTIIWRYMSFAKLISILQAGALFFTRMDLLEDKFEGRLPRTTFSNMDDVTRKVFEDFRLNTAVNCWSMSHEESIGLWKSYVPHKEGVAIRSDIGRLKRSLLEESEFNEASIFIGEVNYVDYDDHDFQENTPGLFNAIIPFFSKRKFFKYENELRAIISLLGSHKIWMTEGAGIKHPEQVLQVPVSMQDLIKTIHVAPQASGWFLDLVRSTVETYGFDPHKVFQSGIEDSPKWE